MKRGPYKKNRWGSALDKMDRKAKGPKKKPAKRKEYALLATSVEEYKKLQREYPNMKVTLDLSHQEQEQLFDTRGLKEDE